MNSLPGRTRIFSGQEYLLRTGADPDAGFVILSGHVELRNATGTLLGNARQGDVISAAPGLWSAVLLRPNSNATLGQMSKRGIRIKETPFGVGRKPNRGKQVTRTDVKLQFPDERPYNLSRHHFVIETGRPGLMIRDAGSQLGTLVNGERIGLDEPKNAVSLYIGENRIEAGGHDTPFRFIIEVLA